MTSQLSAFPFIEERSEATPGLWNNVYSILSSNIARLDFTQSGITTSIASNLSIGNDLWVQGSVLIGVPPSTSTRAALKIGASSAVSDYIEFSDASAQKSTYLLGSRVGGTADGLNIYDESGSTMIVSFSKQSIRFFQNVVGPVFDLGGALAKTYNAATFGTGADSRESRIQSAINQAKIDSFERVYVPASMLSYSASSVSFIYSIQMVREGGDWSVCDVFAYGARGNGTGSDASAIQEAISSSSVSQHGPVYFPSGLYEIGATSLVVAPGSRNVALIGAVPWGLEGSGNTGGARIRYSGSSFAIRVGSNTVTEVQNFHLRDVAILMTSASTVATGLALRNVQPFSLVRPRIVGLTSASSQVMLDLDGSGLFTGQGLIDNPWISNGYIGIRFTGTGTESANAITVIGGSLSGVTTGKAMVFLADSNGNTVLGTNIEGWAKGVEIQSHDNFIHARFESNTTDVHLTSASLRNRITGLLSNTSSIQDDNVAGANSYFLMNQAVFQRTSWQLRNTSDAASYFIVTSGSAADQDAGVVLRDRAEANRWFVVKDSTNSFAIRHGSSSADILAITSNGSLIHMNQNASWTTIRATLFRPGTSSGFNQSGVYTQLIDDNGNARIAFATAAGDAGNTYYDAGADVTSSHIFRADDDTVRFRIYSRGTVDLQQSRLVSMRTAASLDSTTLQTNECAFAFNASGASFAIKSGGTVYYFTSSASTKG